MCSQLLYSSQTHILTYSKAVTHHSHCHYRQTKLSCYKAKAGLSTQWQPCLAFRPYYYACSMQPTFLYGLACSASLISLQAHFLPFLFLLPPGNVFFKCHECCHANADGDPL